MSKRQHADVDTVDATSAKQFCSAKYPVYEQESRIATVDSPRLDDILPSELLVKILHQCRSFRQRLRLGSVCRRLRHCLKEVNVWRDVCRVNVRCVRSERGVLAELSVFDHDASRSDEIIVHTDQLKMAFVWLFDIGRPLRLHLESSSTTNFTERLLLDCIIIAMPRNAPLSVEELDIARIYSQDTNFCVFLGLFDASLKCLAFDLNACSLRMFGKTLGACTQLETLVMTMYSGHGSAAWEQNIAYILGMGLAVLELAATLGSLPRLRTVALAITDLPNDFSAMVLARCTQLRRVCVRGAFASRVVSLLEAAVVSREARARIDSVCCVACGADEDVDDAPPLTPSDVAAVVRLLPGLRRLSVEDGLCAFARDEFDAVCQTFLSRHHDADTAKSLKVFASLSRRERVLKDERWGSASVEVRETPGRVCFVEQWRTL